MDKVTKMNNDLLLKDKPKRKKTEKEIFDKGRNKNTKSGESKVITFKQKFNKKYNQPLNKSNSLKEISMLSKVSEKELKNILEKGEAAFFNNPQSVRPQVKSATQWGVARIYSAVMGGASAKVDKEELKRGREQFKKKK